MIPHDKIGLIIGFTLLGVLLVALFFVLRRAFKEAREARDKDDESFNNFMNNYEN